MRDTLMGWHMLLEMHAYEMHAWKMHAYEMHACKTHACKIHAYEMAPVRVTSMRWPMGDARL